MPTAPVSTVLKRPIARCAVLGAVVAASVQCAAPQNAAPAEQPTTTTMTSTFAPPVLTPGAERPTTVTSTPARATVHPVTAADLGPTWRPGCPTPPERLRRVELTYVGFDDRLHRGELVVDEALTGEVIAIFGDLLRLGFPIERMRTVDHYPGASDELSMSDNNTSAFNCRLLPGGTRPSWHAFGRAIDVNPRQNPYVDRRGSVQPDDARPYLDRRRTDRGLLHADDPAVRVFTDRGWRWGGLWRTPIDYQHFERR